MEENSKDYNVCVKSEMCGGDALGSVILGWVPLVMALAFFGLYPLGSAVLALTFIGGIVMMMVTAVSFAKGSVFGTFVFGPVGIFAMAFPLLNWLPILGLAPPVSGNEAGIFVMIVGLFLGVAGIVTTYMPVRLLTAVAFSASIALTLVGLSNIFPGEMMNYVAGFFLMILAFLSLYLGAALTVNGTTGKMTWPIFLKK
ncbi:MAG TPA: hypothetical protein VMW85_00185 [Methanomassiliicoccales archaeon]|nr:hypothetical protein [Methanomassiliicoccales archaeon]